MCIGFVGDLRPSQFYLSIKTPSIRGHAPPQLPTISDIAGGKYGGLKVGRGVDCLRLINGGVLTH